MRRNKIMFVFLAMICVAAVGLAGYGKPNLPEEKVPSAMHFGISHGMYPEIRFGEDRIYRATRELDKLGLIWLRHPGKGTSWREVQPTRDTWNFKTMDAVLYGNDHPWLIIMYGGPGIVYPFKGNLSKEYVESLGGKKQILDYLKKHIVDMNDPQQRADAERYVKTLVNRYKDRIKYWEIGQEGINAKGKYDIIKYTYSWIKEADPNVKVLVTAVAGDDERMYDEGVRALDSMLAKGLGDYFDIANLHYYERIGGDFEGRNERAFDKYKAVLDKYGVKKPVWVTETSTSSYENSVLSGKSSLQRQAQDVVKRLVIFSAKGADKVFWFDYKQTSPGEKFYGCNIIEHRTGPKPAYHTFKLLVDKIGYYKTVETLRRDNVRLYKFTTDKPIFVAWSDSPQTIDLSKYIEADKVLVTHIIEDNSVQPKTEIAKAGSVRISASPVFIELTK